MKSIKHIDQKYKDGDTVWVYPKFVKAISYIFNGKVLGEDPSMSLNDITIEMGVYNKVKQYN